MESPRTSIPSPQPECKYHTQISWHPSIKVQSPVMAFDQTWLSTFFTTICPPPYSAKDGWGDCPYKPDYVAMHLYTTDPDDFMSTVSAFQKTFGLPLVLSEFACHVSKRICFHNGNNINRFTDKDTRALGQIPILAQLMSAPSCKRRLHGWRNSPGSLGMPGSVRLGTLPTYME